MTLLNNWLASLPFMTAERADYVISLVLAYDGRGNFIYDPLAVISFFCGLFIAVIVAVICTLPHPNLMTKILQGICRTLYFNYSRHANAGADLHYFLRFT